MKAERRHELQTNALAQWLAKTIEQVQPHINTILLVAVGVVALVAAAVYLSGQSEGSAGKAWEAYYKASTYEEVEQRIIEMEGVAKEYAGTPAGMWAKFMAADARLNRGTNASYKDRLAGEDDLEKAQSDFSQLIKDAAALPKSEGEMLLIRSHWGLARSYESLAESDRAIEQYELIAKKWPESSLGKAAAQQAEYLRGLDEDDWYTWYAGVDPTQVKTTQQQPPGGLPFGHPPVNTPASSGSGADLNTDINLRPDGDLFRNDSETTLPDFGTDVDDDGSGEGTTTNPDATEPETTQPDATDSGSSDPAPAESTTQPPADEGAATDSPANDSKAAEPTGE